MATVSASAGFKFLGAFGPAVDSAIHVWLSEAMQELIENSRELCKHKGVQFSIHRTGTATAHMTVRQIGGELPLANLSDWAFDTTINVPVGGFLPPPGKKAFLMHKPEGPVFRTRTYTKFSGQTIKRKGYVSEAVRKTFTQQRLDRLSSTLATMVSMAVTLKLRQMIEARGMAVIIT